MTIRKTLNDLAANDRATYVPPGGMEVRLHDDGSLTCPIKVTIDEYWFTARDLRKTAKLFNKLADKLEAEDRA